ncbi:MAG: hypothetical protein NTV98_03690 [Candidatus Roizmanbacteria bacterium]|nr:hypothetical protein [Candidatus Roizmanbacteria bacterium]
MNPLDSTVTEEVRKSVYDDLADLMIGAVEREELSVPEMKQSATYILGTLDSIKDENQLIEFLHSLGAKWKTYAIEAVKFEGKKQQFVDEEKIKEIQGRLSQFIQTQKNGRASTA